MRFLPLGACLALAIAGPLQSVNTDAPLETPHVSIALSSNAATRSDPEVLLFVEISPKPKMHVYAPGEKDVIPVSLQLDSNPAIKAGKATFPASQKYVFPPLKLTQLVYSKPFRITQPITIVKRPAGDPLTVTGTLEYQACDDAVCYIPKKVKVRWTL